MAQLEILTVHSAFYLLPHELAPHTMADIGGQQTSASSLLGLLMEKSRYDESSLGYKLHLKTNGAAHSRPLFGFDIKNGNTSTGNSVRYVPCVRRSQWSHYAVAARLQVFASARTYGIYIQGQKKQGSTTTVAATSNSQQRHVPVQNGSVWAGPWLMPDGYRPAS